mmetsp:Transcript_37729/g.56983  ORF Transcript_37729/g.56983 Transcript_37729/m.56983 type:complete len:282 (-) Transcript_37729:235-1080(-)
MLSSRPTPAPSRYTSSLRLLRVCIFGSFLLATFKPAAAVSMDLATDARQREVMRREALSPTEAKAASLTEKEETVPSSNADWFKNVMKGDPQKDVHYQDNRTHGDLMDAHAKFQRTLRTVQKWQRWKEARKRREEAKNATKKDDVSYGDEAHARDQAHKMNQGPEWDASMRPTPPPPPENVTILGDSNRNRLEEYDEEMRAKKEHSTGSSATGGAIVPVAFLGIVFIGWVIYNTCQPVKRRKPDEPAAARTEAAGSTHPQAGEAPAAAPAGAAGVTAPTAS